MKGIPNYGSTSGDNAQTYENTLQRKNYSTSPNRRRRPVEVSGYHCNKAKRMIAKTLENEELLLLKGSPDSGSTTGDGGTGDSHTYENSLQRKNFSISPNGRRTRFE